ncbi:ABC transporter permease [Variovorax ginsengisoli]|jgi:peptide/nickel transport system permease protein|uniref:ABC transporter permease n=1 Tax=Variovorax ginsengisoli TaxID=363844 RepID=A0ABT8SJA4_9BURK|nr:ABC transporter permease [Variovorax ginsengisoli]MDN8618902.1 ABC transporter permease [Variovorax ginsengisoli]MDO1538072.1 ABC transporter permease [Variovorax ginsengisoli]
MRQLFLSRLLSVAPILFAVSLFTFLLTRMTATDPVVQILGPGASAADRAEYAHKLGLDRPLVEQFFRWLADALRGDLGSSLYTALPVAPTLADGVSVTLTLAIAGMLLALLIGIPLGIWGAVRHGSWADRLLSTIVSLGLAVPSIWLALLLSLAFAVELQWFQVVGYTPFAQDPLEWARGLVLPAVALSVHTASVIARQMRSAMIDVLRSPYVHALRARGLPQRLIISRYAIRNAMVPVLSVMAIQMSVLVGASIAVERIFAIPALGTLLVDSVVRGDFPVLQGAVVVIATIVLAVNLATDIGYGLINPKVRAH